MSNFLKMCPLGAELFNTDGQTDIMKLTNAFRNLANNQSNTHNAKCPISKQWLAGNTNNSPCAFRSSEELDPEIMKTQIYAIVSKT
jgi:hypothetical protein